MTTIVRCVSAVVLRMLSLRHLHCAHDPWCDAGMLLRSHPTPALLADLAAWSSPPVVSLFVAVDPMQRHLDRRELKAALGWAEHSLVHEHGLRRADAIAMLAPVEAPGAVDSGSGSTVAWFLAPGRMVTVGLAEPLGPAVSVGEVPDALGLLPFVENGPEYHVLAFSAHRVRLFRADRYSITGVEVPAMPRSIEDALWYVKRETTFSRHGSGEMHASGGGNQRHKDDLRRFAQLVDDAIGPVLAGRGSPLVVLGVGYETAIVLDALRYEPRLDVGVHGNPDDLDARGVHDVTWPLVRRQFDPSSAATDRTRALAGTGRVALDLDEIEAAAMQGAVATLLVSDSVTAVPRAQGHLDQGRAQLSRAFLHAASAGADAHSVAASAMPPGATAAALLRR